MYTMIRDKEHSVEKSILLIHKKSIYTFFGSIVNDTEDEYEPHHRNKYNSLIIHADYHLYNFEVDLIYTM